MKSMKEKNHLGDKSIALSLAVVTYNRSDCVFERFLDALYTVVCGSVKPDEIIVINNDDAQYETTLKSKIECARKVWQEKAEVESISVMDWPEVVVRTSSEKNLAVARNLALDTARAPLLVMIDDDQKVESGWLAELVTCLEQYNADVVAGPVYCEYPSSAPLWLQRTDIHNTRGHATGDRLYGITAGNSLIKLSSIDGFRFDFQFGRSGGEDTDFFKRLHESGRSIIWCKEAASVEWISTDRAKAGYAIRRFLDQGQTYRHIFLSDATAGKMLVFYARSALQGSVAGLIAILFILLRRPSSGDWVKRCFNNLGKLGQKQSNEYS